MKQKLHDRTARRKNKHTIIIKIFKHFLLIIGRIYTEKIPKGYRRPKQYSQLT